MDTPGARHQCALHSLYGAKSASINRRSILGGALALISVPAVGRVTGHAVDRAIAAAGGLALLARVRVVTWAARLRTAPGKSQIDWTVEARIEPFARARWDSWPTDEGRDATRTVMIERDRAFIVENGAQTPLAPMVAQGERDTLAVYSYLLLAGAVLEGRGPRRIVASRAAFASMVLTVSADGRIAAAEDAAGDDANANAHPRYAFAGVIMSQGVRFPRIVATRRKGVPDRIMTITDFSVELAPA